MKVLCVVDWPEEGRWLWDHFPAPDKDADLVDFHITRPARDIFGGYGKFLTYYPHYLWAAVRTFPKLSAYDIVVAYHGKNGVPLALLRALSGRRTPKLVILNFTVRGPIEKLSWLLRFAMRGVDCVTYPTQGEMAHSNSILRMPQARIRIVPPAYVPVEYVDQYIRPAVSSDQQGSEYIFASGRSFRDYATLLEAVHGLDVKLIINTRPFCLRELDIPTNVQVNDLLPMPEYFRLLANAKFVVVPLQDIDHGSGESHLGHIMAAGKAVILTENPSATDLVRDGETGIVVKPGDVQEMRNAIVYLLQHPEIAQRMGENAYRLYEEKYTFGRYAQDVVNLLRELSGQSVQGV
jgi:glycosyltransferase involved in cell wall biosynthesis